MLYIGGFNSFQPMAASLEKENKMNLLKKQLCAWLLIAAAVSLTTRTASGESDTILHNFGSSASDGTVPEASLTVSGSMLYGMTSIGGSNDNGTIFEINTDGTGYKILHNFGDFIGDGVNTQGYQPEHAQGSPALVGSTLYGTTNSGGSNNAGTIFKINIDGTGYQVLYNFGSGTGDGSTPLASLTPVGSTLYGTTTYGGTGSEGTIFEINTDGTGYQVLYNFASVSLDGIQPRAPLTLVGSTLYGTALDGHGDGTIFEINTDGTGYQTLYYSGSVNNDGESPIGGLALVGSTLYGTTDIGGSNNGGTIYEINIDNFETTGDASFPMASLTPVGTTLYGTTIGGGSEGEGTIFQINADGTGYQVLHSFDSALPEGCYPEESLTLVGSTLYGTASSGGTDWTGGTIFEVGAPSQTGSLSVSISPAGAVSAGAEWNVDGGAWQSSGATVSGLAVGSHTVNFGAANGYTAPAGQSVTVSANEPATTTGTYSKAVPVTPYAGTYVGLFVDNSGYISICLTTKNKFTGKVTIGGTAHSFKGKFGSTGAYQGATSGAALSVSLQQGGGAGGAPGSYYITGSVSGIGLTAYHTTCNKGQVATEAGEYTLQLTSTASGAAIPTVPGNAILAVGKAGATHFSGKLPDGTAFCATTAIVGGPSGDQCLIYSNIACKSTVTRGARGFLVGAITFPSGVVTGPLVWTKPAQTKGMYPAGFSTGLSISP